MPADSKRRQWLPILFWVTTCASALIILVPAAHEAANPGGQFSGLVVLTLLLMAAATAAVAIVVAVIHKPLAYALGLALLAVPMLWWAATGMGELNQRRSVPSLADQAAGRGYFVTPADRAIAEAIVDGNAAQVAERAPAANLGASGWSSMTFMRLALEEGRANPQVVGALLRAGIDPDQDSSALYLLIYRERNEALLRQVIEAGVDLNSRMGRGLWLAFVRYDWPEGLALILDHGVNTETPDATGYTAIMRAVQAGSWPSVELLLSHGARTDHVGNDGRSLRDLLPEAISQSRGAIPPRIATLQTSLR